MKTFVLLLLGTVSMAAPGNQRSLPKIQAFNNILPSPAGTSRGSIDWNPVSLMFGHAEHAISTFTELIKYAMEVENSTVTESINLKISQAVARTRAPMGQMRDSIEANSLTAIEAANLVFDITKIAVSCKENTENEVSQLSEVAQENFNGFVEALEADLSLCFTVIVNLLNVVPSRAIFA